MWGYILLQIHMTGVQVRLCQVHYVASASHPHTKVSIIQSILCKSKKIRLSYKMVMSCPLNNW